MNESYLGMEGCLVARAEGGIPSQTKYLDMMVTWEFISAEQCHSRLAIHPPRQGVLQATSITTASHRRKPPLTLAAAVLKFQFGS